MTDTSDLIVFWLVVAARFLIPLTIPRYPLPGVITSLVLDAIDQTIFQQFTNLDLAGYQGYDKALDIYYLTIAYISTLRNWTSLPALRISRFLFFYRMVGVVAFGKGLRECERELRSVLEDWILMGLRMGHRLPPLAGISLNRRSRGRMEAHQAA